MISQVYSIGDLDIDLQSGLKSYRRASLIDPFLYTKFHKDRVKFFWPYHIDDFPNFEDTWLDNQDEFQKTDPTKFIYCSILSESEGISKIGSQTAEEIDFENGRFRNFGGALTLTFNRVKSHTG